MMMCGLATIFLILTRVILKSHFGNLQHQSLWVILFSLSCVTQAQACCSIASCLLCEHFWTNGDFLAYVFIDLYLCAGNGLKSTHTICAYSSTLIQKQGLLSPGVESLRALTLQFPFSPSCLLLRTGFVLMAESVCVVWVALSFEEPPASSDCVEVHCKVQLLAMCEHGAAVKLKFCPLCWTCLGSEKWAASSEAWRVSVCSVSKTWT